jgi:hypothetical protein
MVFNGSKESCPNYNRDTNSLDTSYSTYKDGIPSPSPSPSPNSVLDDPLYGTENFNKTCFNICATKNNDETKTDKGATFIENKTCFPCSSSLGETNNPAFGTKNYLMNAGRYKMCNIRSDSDSGALLDDSPPPGAIPLWFTRQQDANISGDTVDRINWSSAGSQLDATDTNSEAYRIQQYWKSTNRGLTNEEILRLIGNRTAGTLEYTLPEEYMKEQPIGGQINVNVFDFEKLRRDINDGRGSVVYCDSNTLNSWVDSDGNSTLASKYKECWNKDTKTYINRDNNKPVFGPEHIVVEEVEDFITSILDEARKNDTSGVSESATQFGNLLSGLQYDSAFEDCVNDKLNTGDLDDFDIQSRIADYTSIKDFRNEDIHYLKRKLRKIINMKTRDVTECMNLLNLGKSICATGVADKTLMIGSLIFKVIGNDRIDIMQADNDEKYKINKLIDELGPLIPRAIKNIIKISKEYEARVCNVPTNTTLLLERLYTDLYDKETKVTFDFTPNFDLNFNELASTTNFWFFIQKITVLIVMSVLLFMAANFVTAFISRTQVITKVNEG